MTENVDMNKNNNKYFSMCQTVLSSYVSNIKLKIKAKLTHFDTWWRVTFTVTNMSEKVNKDSSSQNCMTVSQKSAE